MKIKKKIILFLCVIFVLIFGLVLPFHFLPLPIVLDFKFDEF